MELSRLLPNLEPVFGVTSVIDWPGPDQSRPSADAAGIDGAVVRIREHHQPDHESPPRHLMHPTAGQPRHTPSTERPAATAPQAIPVPAVGAGRRRVTTEVRDTIVQLYDRDGHTIRAIATALSLAYGTVHSALSAANVQMRKRGGSTRRPADTSRPDRRRPGGHLMPRELEVLRHVVEGNGDDATVAALMSTSPSAVHGLWTRLLTRLRVGNRAQAVCYAYDRALIDLGPQPIHTPRLTTQEAALLRHLANGVTHGDLSARLGVTAAAVYARRRDLYAKIGARSAPQAIALAYRHRILTPPHHLTPTAPPTAAKRPSVTRRR